MSRAIASRLQRLEQARRTGGRVVVVSGLDQADGECQTAEPEASGAIRPEDLLLWIRHSGEGEAPAPKVYGSAAALNAALSDAELETLLWDGPPGWRP